MIHFQRLPAPGQISIERVFAEIRGAMPPHIECTVHRSPWRSQGIVPRLRNLGEVAGSAGRVNHIVGDVHYLSLALPGSRTILTIHDCVSLERLRGLKRKIFRWLWYVLPMKRAALVTVVSESTRREVLRHAPVHPGKIRVVHNCVRSEFVPTWRPFHQARPTILQVGTGPNKNLERVAAALNGIGCCLKIIGPLSREQRRLLEEHRVLFRNLPQASTLELLEAYRDADLVIFASTYEGFGLPILEAQATGRPVITSRLFSMPEVAGPAACLVDPYDISAIRKGLVRVLADAPFRRGLVAAGFHNVKRFAPSVIASHYAAAYEELVSGVRGRPCPMPAVQPPGRPGPQSPGRCIPLGSGN